MTNKRAALFWLLQGARRREFRYIYKPGNPSRTRGRAYLFHIFSNDNKDSMKLKAVFYVLIMIICEILCLFLFVLILGIKIHQGWDRSFKRSRLGIFQILVERLFNFLKLYYKLLFLKWSNIIVTHKLLILFYFIILRRNRLPLKDAMPVSFMSELFTFYI